MRLMFCALVACTAWISPARDFFNGSFAAADGWSYTKGAAADRAQKAISFVCDVKRGSSSATYRTKADLSAGGIMRIAFDAEWTRVVPDEPSYSCAGLVMLVEYVNPAGRKIHPKNVNIGFGTREKARYEMEFPVERGARDFWVQFGLRWARGRARISNITMRLDQPAQATLRKGAVAGGVNAAIVNESNAGENFSAEAKVSRSFLIETTPPPAYDAPVLANGEKFAFFRVDSPRRTFDRYPPHASQLQDAFTLQATPGETALLFFGVYAGAEIEDLTAKCGRFRAKDAAAGLHSAMLGCAPALFRAHNWRRGFGRTGAYTHQPEVLFPLEKMQKVAAGGTALLMAEFQVPENAVSGVYEGEIEFFSGGKHRPVRISLKVLPFRLCRPTPDKYEFIVHGGPYAAKGAPDRLAELFRFMKRRGFESALVPCQYAPGMLELEKTPQGRMAIKSFKKLDDALAAYRAAGMTGTLFVHFSDKLEVALAKALGIDLPDALGEQTNMIAEMETPEFKAAAVEVLRLVAERCRDVPFAVLGYDEPNVDARVPRAKWEIGRIEEAGIPSALYCSAAAWKKVPSKIAIASVFPGSVPCGELAKGVASRGGRLYLYAYEGSYGYAFGGAHESWGGLMPSRFTLGLSEFLTPVSTGHTAWLFGTGGTVSASDATAPKGWATLTRYDAQGRLLRTLQLEGECLGVDDYAYMNTLRELLAEKKNHPLHAEISRQFRELLDDVRVNNYPYCLDAADAEVALDGELKSFVNADADAVRANVVELILRLLD